MRLEDKLLEFLDDYTSKYRDYELSSSMGNELEGLYRNDIEELENIVDNYQPVCFATYEFLSETIIKDDEIASIDFESMSSLLRIRDYIASSKGPTLLEFHQNDALQGHSFVCISVCKDRNYVVQSIGGLLAAHYDLYTDDELIEVFIRYALGDSLTLTGSSQVGEQTPYNCVLETVSLNNNRVDVMDVVDSIVSGDNDYPLITEWTLKMNVYDYIGVPKLPCLNYIAEELYEIRRLYIKQGFENKPTGFVLDSRVVTQLESFLALR